MRPTVNTKGVEGTTHDVVSNTGEVSNTATSDKHDRVLLEVVSLSADVGADLTTVGEPHSRNLSQGGVGLLRGLGLHLKADTSSLGTCVKVADLALCMCLAARLADELIDRWHSDSENRHQCRK